MLWILLTVVALILLVILFLRVVFPPSPKRNRRLKRAPVRAERNVGSSSLRGGSAVIAREHSDRGNPSGEDALDRNKADAARDDKQATERDTNVGFDSPAENLNPTYDSDDFALEPAPVAPTPEPELIDIEPKPAPRVQDGYLAIYLLAPEKKPYQGYELLQALLAAGLRFGTDKIFHRFEDKQAASGPVWFSLASLQKPGTFEISRMGACECPGLALFMMLEGLEMDHLQAFECLIETARQLVEDLGGELLDSHHARLTPDAVRMMRERVERFEYLKRSPDLFEEEL